MDRITRIETMEKKLNAALAAVHALDRALEDYAAVPKELMLLAEEDGTADDEHIAVFNHPAKH